MSRVKTSPEPIGEEKGEKKREDKKPATQGIALSTAPGAAQGTVQGTTQISVRTSDILGVSRLMPLSAPKFPLLTPATGSPPLEQRDAPKREPLGIPSLIGSGDKTEGPKDRGAITEFVLSSGGTRDRSAPVPPSAEAKIRLAEATARYEAQATGPKPSLSDMKTGSDTRTELHKEEDDGRIYLDTKVNPTLIVALDGLLSVRPRPANPLEWLGRYLLEHK